MPNPYLTADLPGVGGRIKVRNDDFRVKEIPLYTPSGRGEHTYVTIEKDGLSTFRAIERIARALHINPRSVGCAGLKDAHAVTVQMLSLGDIDPSRVRALDLPGIRVLDVSRHTNKLKMGHLRGNRFVIRIRDVPPEALPAARAILDVLKRRGVPNYYGEQRFGLRGDTHLLGRALLRRDPEELVRRLAGMPHPGESDRVQRARQLFEAGDLVAAAEAWPRGMENERRVVQSLIDRPGDWRRAANSVPTKMRRFYISAYQGALFNRILVRRLGTLDRLQVGDLANIHGKRAVFLVEDLEAEQPRADRLEISPSGPLYGYKLTLAQGMPGQMERQVLDEEGLALEDWNLRGTRLRGARRAQRIPLHDVELGYDEGLVLAFDLPPGCYATTVLAEVTKMPSHEIDITPGAW
jgi:tRNA pseudouridine13 synthase